jgi:serine/threonine protein kinase
MKATLSVQLGVFEVDLLAGELRDGDRVHRLQEQPFQILSMLIARGGQVVTRNDIRQKLWPNDTVVEFDHSINSAIKKLRQALGDSADNPQYIETIARRGYRLLAAVGHSPGANLDRRLSDGSPVGKSSLRASPRVNNFFIRSGLGGEQASEAPTVRQSDSEGLIGRKVSHYRVLKALGSGGMGRLYKAEDLKLGRHVALKFLPEDLAWEPIALRRFEREARTASSLDHPNICTIYEVEEYEEQPFIVMQLLHGETLRERLAVTAARNEPLALAEMLDIAIQICDGLQAAHEKGIVHRDIKPANIFLTTSGQVKLLDFGLAKLVTSANEMRSDHWLLESGSSSGSKPTIVGLFAADANISAQGTSVGTAAYMSPEQVRGKNLDARSDVFSFGLVLYEMATGQRAFTGDSSGSVKTAILDDAPTPVHQLNPVIPRSLEHVINGALEKDREKRYQNIADVRSGLEHLRSRTEPERSFAPVMGRLWWRVCW